MTVKNAAANLLKLIANARTHRGPMTYGLCKTVDSEILEIQLKDADIYMIDENAEPCGLKPYDGWCEELAKDIMFAANILGTYLFHNTTLILKWDVDGTIMYLYIDNTEDEYVSVVLHNFGNINPDKIDSVLIDELDGSLYLTSTEVMKHVQTAT